MVYPVNPFKEYIETLQGAHIESEFLKFKKSFDAFNRIIILGNGEAIQLLLTSLKTT